MMPGAKPARAVVLTLLLGTALAAGCKTGGSPPLSGPCCEPKPGSGTDCSPGFMNLEHPQDVGNPLGHTFGKARCEGINDGQGGCAWNTAKPECKIGGAGPCCVPKAGSTSDCTNPIMNLGHPQDVSNPLGHTFGKGRCEAFNDGNGGCAWDASQPGCKVQ